MVTKIYDSVFSSTYGTDSYLYDQYGFDQNDAVEFSIIEPPDDRYIPGYSITEADGDKKTVGPRLKDLNVPFSLYGIPIPITWGVRRLYGNIIWARPLKETKKKRKSGGKGGPEETVKTYKYFASFAVAFGYPGNTSATDRELIRIWGDGSLMYDRRSTGAVSIPGLNIKFYPGTETQEPDDVIEDYEGVGTVPAFRGLMYLRFFELPVQEFGNRPPAVSVEIGDATTELYKSDNWQPGSVGGSTDQDQELVDWTSGLIFTIDSLDILRTYDMRTGDKYYEGYVNQEGIGWDNNAGNYGEQYLANSTGLELVNCTPTYLPWMERIVCTADSGNIAGRPLGFFSPFTGEADVWLGSVHGDLNASFATSEPAADGDYARFGGGRLPRCDWMIGTYVWDYFTTKTVLAIQGVYGDKYWVMVDMQGNARLIAFKNTVTDWTTGVAGSRLYGESIMYMATGTRIDRYKISTTVDRDPANNGNPYGVVEEYGWLSGLPASVTHLLYYEADDSLIVFMNTAVRKYSSAGVLQWSATLAGPVENHHSLMHLHDVTSGYFAWNPTYGDKIYELNLTTGEISEFTSSVTKLYQTGGFSNTTFKTIACIADAGTGGWGASQTASRANATTVFYYDRLTDERMALSDFLEGVCIYAGYDAADIEIDAAIDDEIDGAIIAQITSFRSIINPILALYRIDMVESDGKVKFRRKAEGTTSVDFTISDGETVSRGEDEPSFVLRREEEAAVPQRVSVRYMDKDLNYNWSLQMATRSQIIETNGSETQITYELPILMSGAEAKALAVKALWYAWNSRVSHQFTLLPKHFKIEPGDVGDITARGFTFRVKAVKVTYNNDYSIQVQSVSFQSDEAVTIEADGGSVYDPTIPASFATETFLIEGPLLRAIDNQEPAAAFALYVYTGPKFFTTSFAGSALYVSLNAGQTWEAEITNSTPGCVGLVSTVPSRNDDHLQTDYTNTITVRVTSGNANELASTTPALVREGANMAAYGVPGRWEYISFETVTDNGDGSYTLSNLLRGVNGTEAAMDVHQINDYFILLDFDWIDYIAPLITYVEDPMLHRTVPAFRTFDESTTKTHTFVATNALPIPPTGLEITRSLSALTGDITLSWKRRSRTLNHLINNAENAPLGDYETNEYLVTIKRWPYYTWAFSGGTWNPTLVEGTTVTHTVTGATTLTLTAAQIRADELYEFEVPDNMTDSGSAFTAQPGSYITSNETENEQIVDLGYNAFVAFKYLDVMIQQKTSVPNSSGYGPGYFKRVYIKDT